MQVSPAPHTVLPDLLYSNHSCNKCYVNKECMIYAKSEKSDHSIVQGSHAALFHHFTNHLNEKEMEYFREWDRLIDLEAHASKYNIFQNWLTPSSDLELRTGKCISGLELEIAFGDTTKFGTTYPKPNAANIESHSSYPIKFVRSSSSTCSTPLCNLKIEVGSQAVISADHTLYQLQSNSNGIQVKHYNSNPKKHQLYMLRGAVENISEHAIILRSSKEECQKIHRLMDRHTQDDNKTLLFRLDVDSLSPGVGTLRQNLLHLFGKDVPPFSVSNDNQSNFNAQNHQQQQENIYTDVLQRRTQWLRNVVVHLNIPPMFDLKVQRSMFSTPRDGKHQMQSMDIPGCDFMDLAMEFVELNPDQRAAVVKVGRNIRILL